MNVQNRKSESLFLVNFETLKLDIQTLTQALFSCRIESKVGIDIQDVTTRSDFKFLQFDASAEENRAKLLSLLRPGLLIFWSCKLFSETTIYKISNLLFTHCEPGTIIVTVGVNLKLWDGSGRHNIFGETTTNSPGLVSWGDRCTFYSVRLGAKKIPGGRFSADERTQWVNKITRELRSVCAEDHVNTKAFILEVLDSPIPVNTKTVFSTPLPTKFKGPLLKIMATHQLTSGTGADPWDQPLAKRTKK